MPQNFGKPPSNDALIEVMRDLPDEQRRTNLLLELALGRGARRLVEGENPPPYVPEGSAHTPRPRLSHEAPDKVRRARIRAEVVP